MVQYKSRAKKTAKKRGRPKKSETTEGAGFLTNIHKLSLKGQMKLASAVGRDDVAKLKGQELKDFNDL